MGVKTSFFTAAAAFGCQKVAATTTAVDYVFVTFAIYTVVVVVVYFAKKNLIGSIRRKCFFLYFCAHLSSSV